MTHVEAETFAEAGDKTAAGDDLFPRKARRTNGVAGVELPDLLRRPTSKGSAAVICVDYNADRFVVQEIEDLPEFIEKHRPEWCSVRWINVHGLGDMDVIHSLAEKYALHLRESKESLQMVNRSGSTKRRLNETQHREWIERRTLWGRTFRRGDITCPRLGGMKRRSESTLGSKRKKIRDSNSRRYSSNDASVSWPDRFEQFTNQASGSAGGT